MSTEYEEFGYEKRCLAGLSNEDCQRTADDDFAIAKTMRIGIASEYKEYLNKGDCPCRASWAAKYDNGVSRV